MATDQGRRPSQRDVARLAGVSRTTVSLVMNGVPGSGIADQTRARVWAAVEQLGFRPNEVARSLRSQRSNVLGLVTHEIVTTPYAVAIVKGALDEARTLGRTVLIIDADGVADDTAAAVAQMKRWQVEGLMLATEHHKPVTLPPAVQDVPTVLVDCFVAGDALPSVVPDERQGGRLATETLLRAGHRRIGFINGPSGYPASTGRLKGYLEALRGAGIRRDSRLIREGDWWQETGAEQAAGLLDLPSPPTALFCGNDWMAMGAYDTIRERGLRIPSDIAVVGFDNRVEIAAHMRPTLTTVALPYEEMGRIAVRRLLTRSGPRRGRDLVPCPLVRRGSV